MHQRDIQTGKTGFTLSAILLFGKNETILSAVPHHKTDAIVRVENLDRYDDRDDIRCNLIESYDRLMAFIGKHLNDIFYLEGDVRVSVRDKLFREIVANLLIHREYSNAFPAKLIIRKNEVYTENANKPHGHGEINIDDYSPFPKNPSIARLFKEIGWAEELGSGIKNIEKYCKIYAKTRPVFIEDDIFTTVIKIKQSADKVPISTEKIIEFLKENGRITNRQGRDITGLSATRVKVIFKGMCDKRIIVAHGVNKDRFYTLK